MHFKYMNAMWKAFVLLLTIVCFCADSIDAQEYTYNNWEAGINAGTTVYQGDLSPSALGNYKRLKPAVGLYVGRNISPYFSVRVHYSSGAVSAADADYANTKWRQSRNLYFETAINNLTARLVFKPYGNNNFTPNSHFAPYVFAGGGLAFINNQRDWSGMSPTMLGQDAMAANLAADTNYRVPRIIPSVPVGGGITYTLSPALSLFGELTYHLSITDYLDGFSNVGNAERKDNYYLWSIGMHWNFFLPLKNGFTKCPSVR